MTLQTCNGSEWMPMIRAARAFGISANGFKRIANTLRIRCRTLPGRRGRIYHRGDVQREIARLEAAEAEQIAAAQASAAHAKQQPGPARTRRARPKETARATA
jgi:hypothetical protein